MRVHIVVAGYHSVSAFGRELGLAKNTMYDLLAGRVAPWPALRRRCSDILDVPEEVLFPDGGLAWRPEPVAAAAPSAGPVERKSRPRRSGPSATSNANRSVDGQAT